VETAAIVTNSRNKDLGRQFLRFLLQEKSQINIAQANWMYPVIKIASGLPPSYAVLAKPKVALRITPDEISKNGDLWIKEWTSVFAR
jgi:thiamine transport system substrate-binding protein